MIIKREIEREGVIVKKTVTEMKSERDRKMIQTFSIKLCFFIFTSAFLRAKKKNCDKKWANFDMLDSFYWNITNDIVHRIVWPNISISTKNEYVTLNKYDNYSKYLIISLYRIIILKQYSLSQFAFEFSDQCTQLNFLAFNCNSTDNSL